MLMYNSGGSKNKAAKLVKINTIKKAFNRNFAIIFVSQIF
jgi:hypothetical protein